MTKLERIEEMEKQLKALKKEVKKENDGFTISKMQEKLRYLETYYTFKVDGDELTHNGGSNEKFTINLGKLQNLIKDIAYIEFDSFKIFRRAGITLDDLWHRIKDIEEL